MGRSIEEIRKAFPYSESCSELGKTINKAINEKSFTSKQMSNNEVAVLTKRIEELNVFYKDKKCDNDTTIQGSERINIIYDKYKDIDQIRIESESIQARNKRLYIGFGVVLLGIGILLIVNKKANG